jgi:hypothetical protein
MRAVFSWRSSIICPARREETRMKKRIGRLSWIFALLCTTPLVFDSAAFGQSPWIVVPPLSQAVPEGGTAYLSVSVTGALPITYTWHRNYEFTNYYSATLDSTNFTLVLSNMTPSQACFFNLDVSNADGHAPGKQVIVAVLSSGMETNGFALTIRGLTNSVWRIDYTTNLDAPDWLTLTNVAIPKAPPVIKFVDLAATNLNRFYRVLPTVF